MPISPEQYNAAGVNAFSACERSNTSFDWFRAGDAQSLSRLADSFAVFTGRKSPTESFPVPKPDALTKPAATAAPVYTPTPTAAPMYTPTPTAAPAPPAPVYLSVTKNPTNENKTEGPAPTPLSLSAGRWSPPTAASIPPRTSATSSRGQA